MRGSATISDIGALVRLHTRHKLLLMAHSPLALSELGRLVASARDHPLTSVVNRYIMAFRTTIEQPATRGGHVNALQHMAGYLRHALADDERAAVTNAIAAFGAGRTALERPIALIRQHAAVHKVGYLLDQVYLNESLWQSSSRD